MEKDARMYVKVVKCDEDGEREVFNMLCNQWSIGKSLRNDGLYSFSATGEPGGVGAPCPGVPVMSAVRVGEIG